MTNFILYFFYKLLTRDHMDLQM